MNKITQYPIKGVYNLACFGNCKIVDGNSLAKTIITKVRQNIQYQRSINPTLRQPCLGIVLVGENEASLSFVSKKIELCNENGIEYKLFHFQQDSSNQSIIDQITQLNYDQSVTGVLVQLPLPEHLDRYDIIQSIDSEKDIDCLHMKNLQKVSQHGDQCDMLPCTPAGIMHILDFYNVNLRGIKATVVGRGSLVGYPLSYMLLKRNAQVTICHKYTPNLQKNIEKVGIKQNLRLTLLQPVQGDWIKEGAVVIDAGVNRSISSLDQYKIVGDVEYHKAIRKASLITPVPGGVGPMTCAMLIRNIYKAWTLQCQLQSIEDEEGHYVADYLIC